MRVSIITLLFQHEYMNNETSYVQSLYFETMLSVWYYGTLLYVASFWCIARKAVQHSDKPIEITQHETV